MKLAISTALVMAIVVLPVAVAADDGDVHTFTGPNGTTLEAEVIDFVDGKVMIRRLSDGASFELAANRLAPADVEFMRAWLERREETKHPLGWKRLRIHLPSFADEVEAPGIPAAFRRTDVCTWEAELPEGAWVQVKIFREAHADGFAPQFLLPWGGEGEWTLEFEGARLFLSAGVGAKKALAGLHIGSQDGDDQLREMTKAIPPGGVALSSEYLEANDFSRLGDGVLSAVVGEVDSFDVPRGAGLRAFKMTEVLRESGGLRGWEELELLDVRCSGGWPLADAASLEALTTLIVDGDVDLASATGVRAFPALRRLSLRDAAIGDSDGLGRFLFALEDLQSLSLPDEHPLALGGLKKCPKLSVLELGDGCRDAGAQGLLGLQHLTTLLMRNNLPPSEFEALAERGHFSKVRVLGAWQAVPMRGFPQLRELWLRSRGNPDESAIGAEADVERPGLDFASGLSVPQTVMHLVVRNAGGPDLEAVTAAAPGLRSLTLRYPSLADLDSLAAASGLKFLRIEDQLVTAGEKLTSLDAAGLSGLRGLSLLRLQNLVTLKTGPDLEALAVRSCSEMKQLLSPDDPIEDRVILVP